MKRRTLMLLPAIAVCALLVAAPAGAQQSVNFQLGSFSPRGVDARVDNDVLLANLDYLWFDIDDLRGATISGDWSVALGNMIEVGAGVGYYERTAPTVWADWVDESGYDLQTDLKLRILPVSAIVRLHPLSIWNGIDPYVGGGVSAYFWRYSETGDFVDFTDNGIYNDRYVGSGTAFGPFALAGVRARVGGRTTIGVEGRYQSGKANLPAGEFLTDRLDLGGGSILFTFGYRF